MNSQQTTDEQDNELPKYIAKYTEGGKEYYRVYIFLRSKKFQFVNSQKRITKIKTLSEAIKKRDKWIPLTAYRLNEKESEWLKFKGMASAFERYWTKYPSRKFGKGRLRDHIARVNNWMEYIANKSATKITIADCRNVIKLAYEEGASKNVRKELKGTMNAIFEWAMQEGHLPEVRVSPAKNIDYLCEGESLQEDERQEILNHGQISTLLNKARRNDHPWYPVWFTGFHSGLRTSELEALRKPNVELVPKKVARELDKLPDGHQKKNYGFIYVKLAWKQSEKRYGKPKAHYWRQVPVNQELYWFLIDYIKNDFGSDEHGERLFPELNGWKGNKQAQVLRVFCEANGLFPPERPGAKGSLGLWGVKFHTIRACFATQMLALGVPENVVMKIGGWKDVETMRIYVRLAGIYEHGATQGLKFQNQDTAFDPTSPYNNVDYRKASEMPDDVDEDDSDDFEEEVQEENYSAQQETSLPDNVINFNAFRSQIKNA